MAFFKFRKGGDEQVAPPTAQESVEAMRKRARHRLIGAFVLVMVGVIGFPLVFDSQPRPVSVDIPIEIPDKQTVKPLDGAVTVAPAAQVVVESDAGKDVTPPVPASRSASGSLAVAPNAALKPSTPKVEPKAQDKKTAEVKKPADDKKPTEDKKPVDKVAEPVAPKPVPSKADDGAKAQALLEGKEPPKAPASAAAAARFVVQIGAYAEASKAQEVRQKLERAGLKT